MSPAGISEKIIAEKKAWIEEMLRNIEALPAASYEEFIGDRRNTAAAESYLRRSLEALMDMGRHLLAKGFGEPAVEYKTIAVLLGQKSILSKEQAEILKRLAGYRNRMVHFYFEISERELYEICTEGLVDIKTVLDAILDWVRRNPEKIDTSL